MSRKPLRKRSGQQQKVRRRLFAFQTLEPRVVLSAMSLVDHDFPVDDGLGEYHHDIYGNEYHQLPTAIGHAEAAGATEGPASLDGMTLADTFSLHSNPGASHTVFLDFDGHVTSGTSWNSFNGGADIVTPAFNTTGDATLADSELSRIQAIWQRVAEDFIPFDVDVTTEEPSLDRLIKSGSGDNEWGVRVSIGGNGSWYGSAGGVAYIGSFNWSSDTPVFVFEDNLGNGNEKYTAEAITHEAGHALGLNHDGRTSPSEGYYQGHGSGATGWAPIMGVGYYKALTQWSRGEYAYANNTQDDLAIITGNNGFGYRADDHGNTTLTASVLSAEQGSVADSGIVERNDDVDVFTFLTDAGTVSFDVTPFERGPNLDIYAALLDATGALIVSSNPIGSLSATVSATLAAGQYFVQVNGAGQGDPASLGYSDYGSLGSYSISGSLVHTNAGYVSISATSGDQTEGDAGAKTFTFTVTRSGDTSSATEVTWAVSGSGVSAADASDFAGGALPSGIVAFAAGETSKTISIDVSGDTDSESDESFVVALSNPTAGTLIATSTANGMIVNDDAAPKPPGITVSPTSGLTTSEAGGWATFSIVLDSAPTSDVTVSLSSSDVSEGIVDKTTLTFTPGNWGTAQIVTVTGVDDAVRDRNVSYVIQTGSAQSSDEAYSGLNVDDVQLTNQDNEKGGGGGKGKKKTPAAALTIEVVAPTDLHPSIEAVAPTDTQRSIDRISSAPDRFEEEVNRTFMGTSKAKASKFEQVDTLFAARTANDASETEVDETSEKKESSLSFERLDSLWAMWGS
ncbi:Calx-beta domain-containing protein [Novipirellula artificiosorum]|uniref:Calx-beta domain protein n=1 Tax=Novipirellula artificiosorum TaxID=2528016 RepID=A0A5C6D7R1_9BACT|nr:Calx-beta domain-containing protein [Novipirellula artificiosorum]TWU31741.1 Calx-beta domain protein [Novipirellula artificiosorum]